MASLYVRGTVVRLSWTFTVDGILTDPGAVTVSIKPPNGSTTSGAATRDSVGAYHYDVDTSASGGVWRWRVTSTAPALGADQGDFTVDESAV